MNTNSRGEYTVLPSLCMWQICANAETQMNRKYEYHDRPTAYTTGRAGPDRCRTTVIIVRMYERPATAPKTHRYSYYCLALH